MNTPKNRNSVRSNTLFYFGEELSNDFSKIFKGTQIECESVNSAIQRNRKE